MERKAGTSSNIKSIGYDPDTQTLEVEFVNGRVHSYANVPPHEHRDLMNASSIGSHFHRNIRNSYSGNRS